MIHKVSYDLDLRVLCEHHNVFHIGSGFQLSVTFKRGRNILYAKLFKVLFKKVIVNVEFQYES